MIKGLQHRFDVEELQSAWAFNTQCFWCYRYNADAFHHVISPCSCDYQQGDFNSSILNSFPIHNFGCHLYNPELHRSEKQMLNKVMKYLLSTGYKLTEKDVEFYKVYKKLY
jgi:hypothetical protein